MNPAEKTRTIKLSQMDAIIEGHLINCRPVIFWGDPGIGKTQRERYAVRQLMKRYPHLDIAHLEFSPNAYTAQDIGGYPKPPGPEERTFSLVPLDMFEELTRHQVAIVYMDEINTAEPMTLAALLRLVQERRAGQLQLPQRTLFIATANPAEQTVAAQDMGYALSSRFTHYHVTADPVDFARHFPSYWGASREELANRIVSLTGDPDKELAIWAEKRALVAAFIYHNPNALLQPPPESSIDRDVGYPNPRNWEGVSAALVADELVPSFDLEANLVGTIGSEYAFSFAHWYNQRDLPDPQKIIENPDGAPIPRRPDMAFATISGLANYVLTHLEDLSPEGRSHLIEGAMRYLDRYIKETQAVDIVQVASSSMVDHLYKSNLIYKHIERVGIDSTVIDLFLEQYNQEMRIKQELQTLKEKFERER